MSVKLLDNWIKKVKVKGGWPNNENEVKVKGGWPNNENDPPLPPTPRASRQNYIAFAPLGISNFALPDTLEALGNQFSDLLNLYERITHKDDSLDVPVLSCTDTQAELFEYLYTHGARPLGFRRVVNEDFRLYEIENWSVVLVNLERAVKWAKDDYQESIKESRRLFINCGQWVELFDLMRVYSGREI